MSYVVMRVVYARSPQGARVMRVRCHEVASTHDSLQEAANAAALTTLDYRPDPGDEAYVVERPPSTSATKETSK